MVNSAIFAGLSRCILWILFGAAVVVFTPSARSTVIWTFHETSCTAFDGSNCTFQPPGGLAQLTLPDVDSSGAWSGFYNATTHTFIETGDTNFLFQLTGSSLQAPGFHPASPADLISNIEFDIAFASSPTSLSIAAIYTAAFNAVCIQQGGVMVPGVCNVQEVRGSFLVGSDFSLVGCNFTQCQINGDWVLVLAPEPSSLAGLASALVALPIVMVLFTGAQSPARGRSERAKAELR
jgi:hypothetical protein